MKTTRLARRLGLDGNPLRRRTDKIAACLAALLVVVFLIGAPLLSVAAVAWAGRAGPAGQRAERSWQQVPAASRQARPAPAAGEVVSYSRVPAQRGAPAGWALAVRNPVSAPPGRWPPVPLWAAAADAPASRPLNSWAVVDREAAAAAGAAAALGIVLLCLAWAGHRVLDRRRLAGWEAEWVTGDSQWGKRFRPSG
jgi:hypothetical protein